MAILKNHTFFDQVTSPTTGSPIMVPGVVSPLATITVAFSGNAVGGTVAFEGKGEIGEYVAIAAKNLTTGSSGSQTGGSVSELWQIPLMGLEYVRCNLTAISSGSLTAVGKVVV